MGLKTCLSREKESCFCLQLNLDFPVFQATVSRLPRLPSYSLITVLTELPPLPYACSQLYSPEWNTRTETAKGVA
jgi:hypothetical protein